LLARLHALPAADLPIEGPTTEERAMARFVEHGIPGPDVCRWIDAHHRQTATTVVHLDFHALNVLFAGARPSAVLDWQNAGVGDPAHDLADARLVFLVGPTALPAVLRPAEQVLRRGLAARLVGRYRHHRRVDDAQLRVGTVLAASRRLLGAILDRPAPGAEATGLTSPELIAALATTIERLTGATPRYPSA
ncbi:MAG: phosphotransferase, partial [Acidimicrobiales bacterium]|nr:phosphotransferase [Acidimicrobiales bacterium]